MRIRLRINLIVWYYWSILWRHLCQGVRIIIRCFSMRFMLYICCNNMMRSTGTSRRRINKKRRNKSNKRNKENKAKLLLVLFCSIVASWSVWSCIAIASGLLNSAEIKQRIQNKAPIGHYPNYYKYTNTQWSQYCQKSSISNINK